MVERKIHKERRYCDTSTKRFIFALVATSFSLNMVWETLHQRAFAIPAFPFYLASICAFGDLVITLGIYSLGALASETWHWWKSRRWHVYAFASLMGLFLAMTTEWYALWSGRWSYSEWMPIVPYLKVGLLPLLQLSLLTPFSFYLAAKWAERG